MATAPIQVPLVLGLEHNGICMTPAPARLFAVADRWDTH